MAHDKKGRVRVVPECGEVVWTDIIGTHDSPTSKAAGLSQNSTALTNEMLGAQYVRVIDQVSKAHTVYVYGSASSTVDTATATLLATYSGRADSSARHGDGDIIVNIAGFQYVFVVVTNNDGSNAANIWVQAALLRGI